MSRRWNTVVLMAAALLLVLNAAAAEWQTDFAKASEEAKAAGKYMLLDFSGSDWCGWCIKLDQEVFSEKAFQDYADENLVLALLDFPRKKALPPFLVTQNEALARKYGIRGFPTVILLSPDGRLAGQTGYQRGGAESYVEHLKSLIETYESNRPEATSVGP